MPTDAPWRSWFLVPFSLRSSFSCLHSLGQRSLLCRRWVGWCGWVQFPESYAESPLLLHESAFGSSSIFLAGHWVEQLVESAKDGYQIRAFNELLGKRWCISCSFIPAGSIPMHIRNYWQAANVSPNMAWYHMISVYICLCCLILAHFWVDVSMIFNRSPWFRQAHGPGYCQFRGRFLWCSAHPDRPQPKLDSEEADVSYCKVMTRWGKRSINTSWTFHWPWKMVHSGIVTVVTEIMV